MKNIVILMLFAFTLFTACSDDDTNDETTDESSNATFTLSSSAIEEGNLLEAYKCEQKVDGIENSIPLSWENVPEGANSLAVVMHHFPNNPNNPGEVNSYLLLWDIDPSILEIPYGTADDGDWFMGSNKDGNAISYTSPCSKSAGSHEYIITVYALSETPADLPKESSVEVTYDTMIDALATVTIIDKAVLTFNDVN